MMTEEVTEEVLIQMSKEMEELAVSHGMPCGRRKRMGLRHLVEFDGDSLFDQFARTVCLADTIPRKELFEAWAFASFVHKKFPDARRIADLACSHGLVSWSLLFLYGATCKSTTTTTSVVCIDLSMPSSAEKLAAVMLKEWPDLKDRWDYVEGSVDGIIPCSSTLMVGVHCCSVLSDKVISAAIHGNSPLALVPCCHSKACLPPPQRRTLENIMNLASFIDNRRIQRLQQAGMNVQEIFIPDLITPKNRVLLATPSSSSSSSLPKKSTRWNPSVVTSKFSIPVGDTPDDKAIIKSLSGREASNQRKAPPPPNFVLCFFLPPNGDISAPELQSVLKTISSSNVTIEDINQERYFDPSSGRHKRTFRFTYQEISSKTLAKELTIQLCHKIPDAFPGASPQQIPR